MKNQDWERFGEEIRRTVQEAVNSRNFEKLSQTVADTVNDAVSGITNTLKQEFTYEEPRIYKNKNSRLRKEPVLYRKTGGLQAGGIFLTAIGLGCGLTSGFLFLIFLVCAFLEGGFGTTEFMRTVLSLSGSIVGFALFGCGTAVRRRVRRFQIYVRTLGGREYCNFRELAAAVGKSVKYIAKDVERMLLGGWFLQGHLDEQGTCLIVSHRMYEQYLMLQAERRQMEASEITEKEYERKAEEAFSERPPELGSVIEEGEAYIQKIHACKEAILGREISAKISRMEAVIRRILDRVERNPECVEDIRRLMEYYLPITVKLLEAYQELEAQPAGGENISSSKLEIEGTLDTLNEAFGKLLDNLFQDTAWDVSSDISVLHTMLAQEGLVEDKLKG